MLPIERLDLHLTYLAAGFDPEPGCGQLSKFVDWPLANMDGVVFVAHLYQSLE